MTYQIFATTILLIFQQLHKFMSRNRSLTAFCPVPSAILDGTEIAALRNWSQSAYCSVFGNFSNNR